MSANKIVFVEPTGSHTNVFTKYMSMPLLGPVYLATIARQAGFDVSILNENILDRKIKSAELKSTDILCLSCITPTIVRGMQIAKEYKSLREASGLDSRVIIGGIHASMLPKDVIHNVDQIVVGEAENVIVDVLSGKKIDKIVQGERLENLNDLPYPDFSLIRDWEKISVWPVMTSRGCVFKCNFCSVTEMFGRNYRTRSIENVIGEIMRYKDKKIFFADDHFVVNPARTEKMLDAMISAGFSRPWSTQLRTEVSRKPSLVRKLQQAGCHTVFIGFESINPDSLKEMKKGQTVEDIKRAISVFQENGIMVHGMFMLGNDSDTKKSFKETSKFCRTSGLSSVQYTILTPLPGTLLFNEMEAEKRLLHKDWEFYDTMHTVFKPKNFTPGELQKGMIFCFRNFYSFSNSGRDAIRTIIKTTAALIRKIYSKTRFPSWDPVYWKFFGKIIVLRWIKFNRPYMAYLNKNY